MNNSSEIDELLGCCEYDACDGDNLFEQALWDASSVCAVPNRPMCRDDKMQESLWDPRKYRLRLMEDMIEYYQFNHVNDDDLDTIQGVMQGVEELGDFSLALWISAVSILASHRVEYDMETRTVIKRYDEVADAQKLDGVTGRTWGQIGAHDESRDLIVDCIEDNNRSPVEECSDHDMKECIREMLNTLPDMERMVLDFRFGLTDGYSRTLEEVGHLFNMPRDKMLEFYLRALRKLRHPLRMRMIDEMIDNRGIDGSPCQKEEPQSEVKPRAIVAMGGENELAFAGADAPPCGRLGRAIRNKPGKVQW